MHTGLRRDRDGNVIPREIINRFEARFDGEVVISANLQPAVSTDPYVEFRMSVPGSGLLEFEWADDNGEVYTLAREITVDRE